MRHHILALSLPTGNTPMSMADAGSTTHQKGVGGSTVREGRGKKGSTSRSWSWSFLLLPCVIRNPQGVMFQLKASLHQELSRRYANPTLRKKATRKSKPQHHERRKKEKGERQHDQIRRRKKKLHHALEEGWEQQHDPEGGGEAAPPSKKGCWS